jgi:hypothetical protein
MAHGPVLAPVGPQAPPRRQLRLRVDTRYTDGGVPPMDYRDDHLRRGKHQGGLACPYNEHEDALGVMPERPVPEIGGDPLRLVEPGVQRQIVGDVAAPFFHGGEGVMVRMWQGYLRQNS